MYWKPNDLLQLVLVVFFVLSSEESGWTNTGTIKANRNALSHPTPPRSTNTPLRKKKTDRARTASMAFPNTPYSSQKKLQLQSAIQFSDCQRFQTFTSTKYRTKYSTVVAL